MQEHPDTANRPVGYVEAYVDGGELTMIPERPMVFSKHIVTPRQDEFQDDLPDTDSEADPQDMQLDLEDTDSDATLSDDSINEPHAQRIPMTDADWVSTYCYVSPPFAYSEHPTRLFEAQEDAEDRFAPWRHNHHYRCSACNYILRDDITEWTRHVALNCDKRRRRRQPGPRRATARAYALANAPAPTAAPTPEPEPTLAPEPTTPAPFNLATSDDEATLAVAQGLNSLARYLEMKAEMRRQA